MKPYKLSIALSFFVLMSFNLDALAESKAFEIYDENGIKVGNGELEKLPFSKAKVTTNYNLNAFTGVGELSKSNKTFALGMQSNRGDLPNKQLKKLNLTLLSDDNVQLNCEIQNSYGKIYGHCIDAASKKLLLSNRTTTNL